MSAKFACKNDGFSFPEIEPRLFSSFLHGACPSCKRSPAQNILWAMSLCDACKARDFAQALNVFNCTQPSPERRGEALPSGKADYVDRRVNILDLASLSIADAHEFSKSKAFRTRKRNFSASCPRNRSAIRIYARCRLRLFTTFLQGEHFLRRRSPAYSLGFSLGLDLSAHSMF